MLNRSVAPPWPDVCCVWLPQFPLRVAVLQHPAWDGLPLVLSGGARERKVVKLCSPEAERAGIRPGLPLREVMGLCRDAVILEADPVRTTAMRQEIIGQLCRLSPAVEPAEEEVFLDLRGLQALYRGDLGRLERDVRAAISPVLQPHLGVAGGKFTASVAARLSPPPGLRVVPAADAVAFLARLPLRYLPLPPEMLHRLELVGLRRIADLGALPFSAVQAQLGPLGVRAWRLAHGRDDEPIVPYRPEPSIEVSIQSVDGWSNTEAISGALRHLLKRAFGEPSLRGRSARQVCLSALLVGGGTWERVITFKDALGGWEGAHRAIQSRIELPDFLPTAPIDELSLQLQGLSAEGAKQPSLLLERARRQDEVAEAVRQLSTRYGHSPLYHAVALDPHSRIPERRWALTPYDP